MNERVEQIKRVKQVAGRIMRCRDRKYIIIHDDEKEKVLNYYPIKNIEYKIYSSSSDDEDE